MRRVKAGTERRSGRATERALLSNMKKALKIPLITIILGLLLTGCEPQTETPESAPLALASPTGSTFSPAQATTVPITLPLKAALAKNAGPAMLPGPNAVPADTRIVVNIPAFRMDVFARGSLVK